MKLEFGLARATTTAGTDTTIALESKRALVALPGGIRRERPHLRGTSFAYPHRRARPTQPQHGVVRGNREGARVRKRCGNGNHRRHRDDVSRAPRRREKTGTTPLKGHVLRPPPPLRPPDPTSARCGPWQPRGRARLQQACGKVWVGEVGCVCVVWCCCCKSMPSYFLIPSIAVLFCYWHQTPPATPLLCCLSPRPAAQTKQQPPQQARSRQQPAGQHAAICRASSAVRLRGFVAPSSAGLDRAVAVFGRRGSCCPTTSCGS